MNYYMKLAIVGNEMQTNIRKLYHKLNGGQQKQYVTNNFHSLVSSIRTTNYISFFLFDVNCE